MKIWMHKKINPVKCDYPAATGIMRCVSRTGFVPDGFDAPCATTTCPRTCVRPVTAKAEKLQGRIGKAKAEKLPTGLARSTRATTDY
mmetsp:Transcript_30356/g.37224  ORF Transcript_30356/g.37224 Transcript_30356/m.37224 type:complete len:87 (-) Transcript_30356:215-475(-)